MLDPVKNNMFRYFQMILPINYKYIYEDETLYRSSWICCYRHDIIYRPELVSKFMARILVLVSLGISISKFSTDSTSTLYAYCIRLYGYLYGL